VQRCPKEAKGYFNVWGEPSSDILLMQGLKRALDPNSILNPGRFVV
jgi:FAD/FMN-containing dehydrogenase